MRDVVTIITELGLALQELGRPMRVCLGVEDDLTEAIAVLPQAEVTETIYVKPDEAYVIRGARVRLGRVEIHAQCRRRPATSQEVESASRWFEHHEEYRAGALKVGS